MRPLTAYVVLAALMIVAAADPAEAQRKAEAKCEACRQAAEHHNQLLDEYDRAVRKYRETSKAMNDLWEQKWSDERELQRKRGTVMSRGRQEHLKMLEERIAAAPAAIDKASKEYAEAYANMQDLLRQVAAAWVALVKCNERCGAPGAPEAPRINVNPGTPTTAGSSPPPTPVCIKCEALLSELEALEQRRREAHAKINESNRRSDERQPELNELLDKSEMLRMMRTAGDPSVKLTEQEYNSRLAETRARIKQIQDLDARGFTERFVLWGELDQIEKSIKEWWTRWRDCNQRCVGPPLKNSTWFSRPLFWVPISAAGVIGTVAAGGDNSPIAVGTVATPQQQINTTPSGLPTSSPPPTGGRRPATALNVNGCSCAVNSALFDGTLQLCLLLRLIRTAGSGNSMTITGDAPLPAFQGTFNENTGAFELMSPTTIGNVTSNAVISGTVEMNGNFSNLRVSFTDANGRQTLYTLTTATVQ